jgi:hypothetical protein
VATGAISAPVAALTEGVLKTMMLTKLRTTAVVLLLATFVGIGGSLVALHTLAADPLPVAQKETASQPVRTREADPTLADLCKALGMSWWQFDLPKDARTVEVGLMDQDHFTPFEQCELRSGLDTPGPLKVAYQEEGLEEYKLVVLTKDGILRLGKKKKPAEFTRTHGRAVKRGEFFELMTFKRSEDKGWRWALVIRITEKPD